MVFESRKNCVRRVKSEKVPRISGEAGRPSGLVGESLPGSTNSEYDVCNYEKRIRSD